MDFPLKSISKKPFPKIHSLREKTPLFFDESSRTCYVLSYKLISQILSEKENEARVLPDGLEYLRLSLPSLSGIDHKNTRSHYFEKISTLLRHDFSQVFKDRAEHNLDALKSNWFAELSKDLVTPYVVDCVCLVYGIKRNAWDNLIQLIPSSDLEMKKNIILDALDERGLLYQICFTHEDWPLEKQLAEFNIMLAASKDNLVRSLMNLIPFFLSNKKAMDILRDKDVQSEQLVIEGLRLHGPLWMLTRSYNSDLEFSENTIPNNHSVKLCVFSGNRDVGVFDNPDSFDPTRTIQPLLYGRGLRRCPGEKFANNILFAFFDAFREYAPLMRTWPIEFTKRKVGKFGLSRSFETYHIRMVQNI
tara:strand:- start:625 stop:1707 length:1083 start_codon:yes stop_codon:yes gene_type:complete